MIVRRSILSNRKLICTYLQISTIRQKMTEAMTRIQVNVNQGVLSGVTEKFNDGRPYFSFRGIPFAEPPVGNLRFKPPVPLTRFKNDIQDCSAEGDASMHKDPYSAKIVGSEDCLYLNVYTPKLPKGTTNPKLPVMVWIHGGAFYMDSGSEKLYSPKYLIEKDVIVVTINYRLGPFGFLHHPQAGIIGNAGLKDQLLALKWVNENITSFGGDSKNVTLFGESAGGASTHLHLLSPDSKPYFQRAICQSGTSLNEWVVQKNPEYKANKIANEIAQKELKEPTEIYDTLMKATPLELLANMQKSLTEDEKRRGLPMALKPVVDGTMIRKPPLELMKIPNEKPVMLGYTSAEGLVMLLDAFKKLDIYDSDLARMIPRSLNVEQGTDICNKVAADMKKFYFGDKPVSMESINGLTNLMSDYHFILGIQLTTYLHAKENKSPVYMYRFSYNGDLNMVKKLFGFEKHPGACHADENFYLFQAKMIDYDIDPTSKTAAVRNEMCRLWTNFAKTGNPNLPDQSPQNTQWEPVKPNSEIDCLDINDKLEMVKNPEKDRIEFWKNLYRTYNQSVLKPKL